jgi:hypothetical protein
MSELKLRPPELLNGELKLDPPKEGQVRLGAITEP